MLADFPFVVERFTSGRWEVFTYAFTRNRGNLIVRSRPDAQNFRVRYNVR